MLSDYRCMECGTVAERVVSRPAPTSMPCGCGSDAKRVYSPFAFKSYVFDRSNFHEVAPLNEDGKPMTLAETAKTATKYRRGEALDIRNKNEADREKRNERFKEEAKREAWADRRVVIRGGK